MQALFRPFCKYTTKNPFVPKFYAKYYEVIPLPIICAWVMTMVASSCIKTSLYSDCVWTNHGKKPWQRVDKLLNPDIKTVWYMKPFAVQKCEPNQELYDIYEDMRQAEEEQKKAKEEENS